jgi:hypothetical protein
MKELLDKGKQKIVRDSRTLASVVEEVLKNKKTTGQDGFEYVKNFNISYFENEWINIVSQLVNE